MIVSLFQQNINLNLLLNLISPMLFENVKDLVNFMCTNKYYTNLFIKNYEIFHDMYKDMYLSNKIRFNSNVLTSNSIIIDPYDMEILRNACMNNNLDIILHICKFYRNCQHIINITFRNLINSQHIDTADKIYNMYQPSTNGFKMSLQDCFPIENKNGLKYLFNKRNLTLTELSHYNCTNEYSIIYSLKNIKQKVNVKTLITKAITMSYINLKKY